MVFKRDRHIVMDFETSGAPVEHALQPWRLQDGTFWATSLVWSEWAGDVIKHQGGLQPDVAMMERMLRHAIDNDKRIIGWNTTYDISVLVAYGFRDLVLRAKWLDGMLLWKHLEVEPEYDTGGPSKKKFKLKGPAGAVETFLPHMAGYEEDIDFHDPDPVTRAKLHAYNIKDCEATLIIAEMLWERMTPEQRRIALIEAESLPVLAEANVRGMLIDTIACRDLAAWLGDRAERAGIKLAFFGLTDEIARSPTQLSKLLYDEWQLPVIKMNKPNAKGQSSRSTDKEALHELSFLDPRVADLQDFREAVGNKTKFADNPLEAALYNGHSRAHPTAFPFSTYTSRITYASKQGKGVKALQTGWAIHQEKSFKKKGDEDYRRVVIAPNGYDMVEFDAAGQEFRWMAVASGDPVMLDLCRPGEDPHSFMGARCSMNKWEYRQLMAAVKAKDPLSAPIRKNGKVGNLSLQYRTSAPKLRSVARVQYGIPMSMDEAVLIHKVYQRTYAFVPKYWDRQIIKTKREGYVETMGGRRVQVMGDWTRDGWRMGSTAINYPIQGTGGDQKYLAIAIVKNMLLEYDAYFMLDMHDGLYFLTPCAKTEAFIHAAKVALDNLPYERAWGFTPPCPMPFDCKWGQTWGDLSEYAFAA